MPSAGKRRRSITICLPRPKRKRGSPVRALLVARRVSPVCGTDRRSRRDDGALGKAGIGAGIHYPIPLHRQRAYESLGYKVGDFPVTEKVASRIVSLPMFPNLTGEQQRRVASEVGRFLQAALAAAR